MPLFDEFLLLRHQMSEEESAKIKHEREKQCLCQGRCGIRTWQLHETLSLWQLGARPKEVIDGFITKHRQVLKVVENIGTVEGFGEDYVRNLRCCLAAALGLVVTESLTSPVLYCWQLIERLGALANDPDVWVPKWCRHG